ncbi:MAG TPA: hypothetical protein PKI92_00365 [Candidatus Woesebacteria bacterium]|nr:hypothetical protein [Candidatus Woesebacteria bacterium]HPR99332.1 hypothetical protein [Candidatus Woesebacteria bacterium]
MTKIAVFFGGKISKHLVLVREAARKMGVDLDLVSYNQVCFETGENKVKIRSNIKTHPSLDELGTPSLEKGGFKMKDANDYDVLFFRTTGKHWEEVDLIINSIDNKKKEKGGKDIGDNKGGHKDRPYIVDPLVMYGKPSYACKAWQMLKLKEAGIDVPKSIYGSLWYLYEVMKGDHEGRPYKWPVIIKGSGGDRGTRVFKANNLEELERLVRDLRKSETEEGRRYMLQEYIENEGDFRILVLGEKVLGVMKRARTAKNEFRNNYSVGGTVEVANLPEEIKKLAVKAARVCGLAVAGVDVAFRDNDFKKPVIWEVNKGPQFKGFMKATGIDVPAEIVKYLVSLVK